jgi:hypothetical protein
MLASIPVIAKLTSMWMSLLTADHINNNFIIYTNKACLTSTFEITSELVSLAILEE